MDESLPMIFSCSLCGKGGASLGASGLFSTLIPVAPSLALRAISFSLTPPDVPVVPSLGPARLGSFMTPSLVSGILTPSKMVGSRGRPSSGGRSFFRSLLGEERSLSTSTKGPSWGRPSLPSTGASLVPGFEDELIEVDW